MKRFQHWAKIANHPNLPLVRFVSFLFLILLEWITSSLGVPLSPSPYRVPIPKTTAFISSNIQKLHALLVSPDKTKTKNTITQVISNQVSTGCGHYILFNESITLADRDLEFFVACPAGFSSFCDSNFFLLKIRRGARVPRAPPIDPPLNYRNLPAKEDLPPGKEPLVISWHYNQIPWRDYWDSN